jgi:hypothetical protein
MEEWRPQRERAASAASQAISLIRSPGAATGDGILVAYEAMRVLRLRAHLGRRSCLAARIQTIQSGGLMS